MINVNVFNVGIYGIRLDTLLILKNVWGWEGQRDQRNHCLSKPFLNFTYFILYAFKSDKEKNYKHSEVKEMKYFQCIQQQETRIMLPIIVDAAV